MTNEIVEVDNFNINFLTEEQYEAIENPSNAELYAVEFSDRSLPVGAVIPSLTPLVDDGLHLLDGAELQVGGIYDNFINDYAAPLFYETATSAKTYNVTLADTITTEVVRGKILASGFASNKDVVCSDLASYFESMDSSKYFRIVLRITTPSTVSDLKGCTLFNRGAINPSNTVYYFRIKTNTEGIPYIELCSNGVLNNDLSLTTALLPSTEYEILVEYEPAIKSIWFRCQNMNTQTSDDILYNLPSGAVMEFPSSNGASTSPYICPQWNGQLDLTNSFYTLDIGGTYTTKYMATLSAVPAGLFCTEQEWQDTVAQYGRCDKYVYTEGESVRLPKHEVKRELVKAYKNGYNWYNLYSDGWCEQGGLDTTSSSSCTVQIVKPYIDTSYTVTITGSLPTSTDTEGWSAATGLSNVTTTSFRLTKATEIQTYWRACGYAEVPANVTPELRYLVVGTTTKTEVEVDMDNITTDLNNKADKDLSNCTSSTFVDGQWVSLSERVQLLETKVAGDNALDLSSYLPSDNYNYEIIGCIELYNTSSNPGSIYFTSSVIPLQVDMAIGDSSSTRSVKGFTFPIGADKVLNAYIYRGVSNYARVYLNGYRRIGTNS